MHIRAGTLKDYKSCKQIADQFDESTPTEKVFSELVANSQIFVYTEQGEILGFCSYKLLWNDTVCLQFLRVDTSQHRKGIASMLIKEIEYIALQKGYYALLSTILESNTPSKRLHKKQGFIQNGYINFSSGKELVFLKEL